MNPQTLSRRQEAQRQRELDLIAIAREIIEEEDINSLTMDKVTARCEYSKGTVYNHFSCKEDLLVAVSNEGLKDLRGLFKKLLPFKGNTREQILGFQLAYLYFSKLYPSQFLCILTVKNPSVLGKTSEHRKLEQISLEIELENQALEIINQAIENQELKETENRKVKQISFANWSQTFGSLVLVNSAGALVGLQGVDISNDFFQNAFVLNDGFEWHPLSKDFNYFDSIERLKQEIFPTEEAQIRAMFN